MTAWTSFSHADVEPPFKDADMPWGGTVPMQGLGANVHTMDGQIPPTTVTVYVVGQGVGWG